MDLIPADEPCLTSLPKQGFGRCACHPTRRLFTGLVAGSALLAGRANAQDGVVLKDDRTAKYAKQLAPVQEVERAGAMQYAQMMGEAQQQRVLAPASHPQVERLRYIGQRLLPFAPAFNARARQWKWEVNLITSKQLNAFCMPGGKIAFFSGILVQLELTDDEVATIMGHEIAHALREHARERMGKTMATRIGANVLSAVLGLGNVGDAMMQMGAQLMTLKFGREDESEADLVGMDLATRAGYNPRAGISLWQKMGAVGKGAPPQWLSTHPSGPTRIKDIEASLPQVANLVSKASKPDRRFPVARA